MFRGASLADILIVLVTILRRPVACGHGLGPADRTTLLAGPGFDASVWETWAPLTAGASLHVPPPETS